MKKFVCCLYFIVLTNLSFALPNIKLYKNAELSMQIRGDIIYDAENTERMVVRDGKLYAAIDDEYLGVIAETADSLIFSFYTDGTLEHSEEYRIPTGYLTESKDYFDGKLFTSSLYDEKTGLETKQTHYSDGGILFYVVSEYEKNKLSKEFFYNPDDSPDSYAEYMYDKKTGTKIKRVSYNMNNQIKGYTEYDRETGFNVKEVVYNDNGSLKTQTTYDKDTGKALGRLDYSSDSKKPTKWTFLLFDSDGNYNLSDGYYLNCKMCDSWDLKNYEQDSRTAPVEWNENFSARVRKYDFTQNSMVYKHIKELREKHFLSEKSFVLGNKNSNFYYFFNTDSITNEIDISSCYEIELMNKVRDYPAMNKSGKNKGPFGFDIGMTYDEVKEACGGTEPEYISGDCYYVKPKKSHPALDKYIVWISDSVGLYYVKGISRDIISSEYGTEVKRSFNNLLIPLEKKYGKFTLTDTVKPDSYWKDDKHWMQTLSEDSRTYRADWIVTAENYKDFDGLFEIMLTVNRSNNYSPYEAYISIEYCFLNYEDAQKSLDDVL